MRLEIEGPASRCGWKGSIYLARPMFPYNPALDGIRGLAVIIVAISHCGYILGAHVGVDIFFTLSGFLITFLLIKEWTTSSDISLKRFYARRALRLCPALIVLLAAACLYESVTRTFPGASSVFLRAGYALLYVVNWVWALNSDLHLGGLGALAPLVAVQLFGRPRSLRKSCNKRRRSSARCSSKQCWIARFAFSASTHH